MRQSASRSSPPRNALVHNMRNGLIQNIMFMQNIMFTITKIRQHHTRATEATDR